MRVTIWVNDSKVPDLGIPTKEAFKKCELTIIDSDIRAYWITPEEDSETGTKNIQFYTHYDNFSAPWSDTLEDRMSLIISEHEKPIENE